VFWPHQTSDKENLKIVFWPELIEKGERTNVLHVSNNRVIIYWKKIEDPMTFYYLDEEGNEYGPIDVRKFPKKKR
jgi:hypothetical protein